MSKKLLPLFEDYKSEDVSLWGMGTSSSLEAAVFFNGCAADGLDWEDCSWTGHPSAAVIPVALGFVQANRKSGIELIEAIVAGYEVYQRVAMALQPSADERRKRGWGFLSWQLFAGVATGIKVMSEDPEVINNALSMGALSCIIPTSFHAVTLSNAYHYEHGLRNVTAVKIVKQTDGLKGNPKNTLDDHDFLKNFTDFPESDWLSHDFKEYLIAYTMLKKYPGNMWSQLPMEITGEILKENNIEKKEIERILISPGIEGRFKIPEGRFETSTIATLNIPFGIANIVNNTESGMLWFSEENRLSSNIVNMAKKVVANTSHCITSAEAFDFFRRKDYVEFNVSVKTYEGTEYSKSKKYPTGHPKNNWSKKELEEWFVCVVGSRLDKKSAKKKFHYLFNIESERDINSI